MMTITVEEARIRLSELIDHLAPGEKLVMTRNGRPIAQLVGLPAETPCPVPVPGRGRGKLMIVSEDEDHLENLEDYMP